MIYGMLADTTVLLHAAFVLFAAGGAVLVVRWQRLAWLHLPVVLWAALVEIMDWGCPLTPLENFFRRCAGQAIYQSDFIDHYIVPLLYPATLTRELQMALGLSVLIINGLIYLWLWHRPKRKV